MKSLAVGDVLQRQPRKVTMRHPTDFPTRHVAHSHPGHGGHSDSSVRGAGREGSAGLRTAGGALGDGRAEDGRIVPSTPVLRFFFSFFLSLLTYSFEFFFKRQRVGDKAPTAIERDRETERQNPISCRYLARCARYSCDTIDTHERVHQFIEEHNDKWYDLKRNA